MNVCDCICACFEVWVWWDGLLVLYSGCVGKIKLKTVFACLTRWERVGESGVG